MTATELLQLIKLLSAPESLLMSSKVDVPDHLWEVFVSTSELVEREMFRAAASISEGGKP